MMNSVCIAGRLTKLPELKTVTDEHIPVVNFTVAVERDYQDENNDRKVDFIPVVAWNGTAKFIVNNFGKGGNISVQGRLQTRNWEDTEGKKHYNMEIIAEKAYFSGDSKKGVEEDEVKYKVS